MESSADTNNTGQFLLIRRAFVEAHWRDLYLADEGAITSLVLVLLSMCWGYGEQGASVRLNRIRRLSGLEDKPGEVLSAARNRLHRLGIVLKLPSQQPGIWRFRDGGRMLADVGERRRFHFPIRLLRNAADEYFSDWALLSPEARAVMVALASRAKSIWSDFDIPNDDWVTGDGVREPFVRNVGELIYPELARATGLDEKVCESAVDSLSAFGLVDVDEFSDSLFRLPDDVWHLGYAAQREKFIGNQRQLRPRRRQSQSAIESMLPLEAKEFRAEWF